MKYLKYFEKIKNKNIAVGKIYRIGYTYIGSRKLIPLVKIINMVVPDGIILVKCYFEDSKEEFTFNLFKKDFTNIATPEEIDYFNSIESSKKYNL